MHPSHRHITIVDADADTVAMLVAVFELLGLVATPCPIGPAAAAAITQLQPRVLILDMLLAGGRSGVDVLAEVRRAATMRAVPVIFFSGSEHYLRRVLPDYACQGIIFVEKPDIAQLSAVVQRLLALPAG